MGVAFITISNAEIWMRAFGVDMIIPNRSAFLFNLCINEKYRGQGICSKHLMKAIKKMLLRPKRSRKYRKKGILRGRSRAPKIYHTRSKPNKRGYYPKSYLNLAHIILFVYKDNEYAIKCYKKGGFKIVGNFIHKFNGKNSYIMQLSAKPYPM